MRRRVDSLALEARQVQIDFFERSKSLDRARVELVSTMNALIQEFNSRNYMDMHSRESMWETNYKMTHEELQRKISEIDLQKQKLQHEHETSYLALNKLINILTEEEEAAMNKIMKNVKRILLKNGKTTRVMKPVNS